MKLLNFMRKKESAPHEEYHVEYKEFVFLFLITTVKIATKVSYMMTDMDIPVHYFINAEGTASSQILGMLGLGSLEKTALVVFLPKPVAQTILKKLKNEFKTGTVNSGIAFTIPIDSSTKHLQRLLDTIPSTEPEPAKQGETKMNKTDYSMITAVVNHGYGDEVMEAARSAGANGGSIVHCRRILNEETQKKWGLGIAEGREAVIIISYSDSKQEIMKAISEKCGIKTEAKGLVFSLPVDSVIGLPDRE